MPSKQNNIFKEAFDSIAFLGFVALLSIAATKASAWEGEMCRAKSMVKSVAKHHVVRSGVAHSSPEK